MYDTSKCNAKFWSGPQVDQNTTIIVVLVPELWTWTFLLVEHVSCYQPAGSHEHKIQWPRDTVRVELRS